MASPISPTTPGQSGSSASVTREGSSSATGTGDHSGNILDKVMADIERRRDQRDQKAVGAVGSGSIHTVGKVLRENQRAEAADRVLLKAVQKYDKSIFNNAKKIKIA